MSFTSECLGIFLLFLSLFQVLSGAECYWPVSGDDIGNCFLDQIFNRDLSEYAWTQRFKIQGCVNISKIMVKTSVEIGSGQNDPYITAHILGADAIEPQTASEEFNILASSGTNIPRTSMGDVILDFEFETQLCYPSGFYALLLNCTAYCNTFPKISPYFCNYNNTDELRFFRQLTPGQPYEDYVEFPPNILEFRIYPEHNSTCDDHHDNKTGNFTGDYGHCEAETSTSCFEPPLSESLSWREYVQFWDMNDTICYSEGVQNIHINLMVNVKNIDRVGILTIEGRLFIPQIKGELTIPEFSNLIDYETAMVTFTTFNTSEYNFGEDVFDIELEFRFYGVNYYFGCDLLDNLAFAFVCPGCSLYSTQNQIVPKRCGRMYNIDKMKLREQPFGTTFFDLDSNSNQFTWWMDFDTEHCYTSSPSERPTGYPSWDPTVNPTQIPTNYPSNNPSEEPSSNPTMTPSSIPTSNPSINPSGTPTMTPSRYPTSTPVSNPTKNPLSANETSHPTNDPTMYPSENPSINPTSNPSGNPSSSPSSNPSITPSSNPTYNPITRPTDHPSQTPTAYPSKTPTAYPSKYPTIPGVGTDDPSTNPTISPTRNPTPSLDKCELLDYADDCPINGGHGCTAWTFDLNLYNILMTPFNPPYDMSFDYIVFKISTNNGDPQAELQFNIYIVDCYWFHYINNEYFDSDHKSSAVWYSEMFEPMEITNSYTEYKFYGSFVDDHDGKFVFGSRYYIILTDIYTDSNDGKIQIFTCGGCNIGLEPFYYTNSFNSITNDQVDIGKSVGWYWGTYDYCKIRNHDFVLDYLNCTDPLQIVHSYVSSGSGDPSFWIGQTFRLDNSQSCTDYELYDMFLEYVEVNLTINLFSTTGAEVEITASIYQIEGIAPHALHEWEHIGEVTEGKWINQSVENAKIEFDFRDQFIILNCESYFYYVEFSFWCNVGTGDCSFVDQYGGLSFSYCREGQNSYANYMNMFGRDQDFDGGGYAALLSEPPPHETQGLLYMEVSVFYPDEKTCDPFTNSPSVDDTPAPYVMTGGTPSPNVGNGGGNTPSPVFDGEECHDYSTVVDYLTSCHIDKFVEDDQVYFQKWSPCQSVYILNAFRIQVFFSSNEDNTIIFEYYLIDSDMLTEISASITDTVTLRDYLKGNNYWYGDVVYEFCCNQPYEVFLYNSIYNGYVDLGANYENLDWFLVLFAYDYDDFTRTGAYTYNEWLEYDVCFNNTWGSLVTYYPSTGLTSETKKDLVLSYDEIVGGWLNDTDTCNAAELDPNDWDGYSTNPNMIPNSVWMGIYSNIHLVQFLDLDYSCEFCGIGIYLIDNGNQGDQYFSVNLYKVPREISTMSQFIENFDPDEYILEDTCGLGSDITDGWVDDPATVNWFDCLNFECIVLDPQFTYFVKITINHDDPDFDGGDTLGWSFPLINGDDSSSGSTTGLATLESVDHSLQSWNALDYDYGKRGYDLLYTVQYSDQCFYDCNYDDGGTPSPVEGDPDVISWFITGFIDGSSEIASDWGRYEESENVPQGVQQAIADTCDSCDPYDWYVNFVDGDDYPQYKDKRRRRNLLQSDRIQFTYKIDFHEHEISLFTESYDLDDDTFLANLKIGLTDALTSLTGNTELAVNELRVSTKSGGKDEGNGFSGGLTGNSGIMFGGIAIVIAIASLLVFCGLCAAQFMGADNLRYTAILLFSVYTWDFFSDIFFAGELFFNSDNLFVLILFVLSVFFVILPIVLNFKELLSFQDQWQKDPLHADRYRSWLNDYATPLFILSFICGSCFAAVELVNSNLFGSRLFSMGLSRGDLRKFNQKRLINVIFCENIPQIMIQIAFVVQSGLDPVTFLALISSSMSVIIAWLNWCTQKKLMDDDVRTTFFSIKVTSTEIERSPKKYKNKMYNLAAEIARIFPLDRSAVEMLPSHKYSDRKDRGLMLYFLIATKKFSPGELYEALLESQDDPDGEGSHFGRQLQLAWRLKNPAKTYGLLWIKNLNLEKHIKDNLDDDTNTNNSGETPGLNKTMSQKMLLEEGENRNTTSGPVTVKNVKQSIEMNTLKNEVQAPQAYGGLIHNETNKKENSNSNSKNKKEGVNNENGNTVNAVPLKNVVKSNSVSGEDKSDSEENNNESSSEDIAIPVMKPTPSGKILGTNDNTDNDQSTEL